MRILTLATLLAVLASGTAQASPPQTVEQALAGRTPGKPTSCIPLTRVDSTEIFDSGAILYRMKGGPDYLNTPPHCSTLRHDRAISTRTPTGSICSGDIIRIFDAPAHFDFGGCGLGEFVPYPRVKKAQ
ncbi:hypothetical protein [Sphingomonas sp. PR090111-T3T-6A]|uniref:hypothetical protein n=1 Tax=Sphingomonas sp. PR090111-T3T-6A TaxID=685778 RepID=UPI00037763C3|nr:hypothetical protein [Sphingomonas sp. PR090111-T3T-6A]